MSTRIFSSFALVLLVTACGKPDNDILAEAEDSAAAQAADDGRIECALDGKDVFSRGCQTEVLSAENGATLIVRHPDGGFRRFNVLTDGRGLEAADGSEKARIEIVNDEQILVSVGPDKYLMSARMKTSDTADTANQADEPAPQAGS
ncbi:hypothetical protein [Parasphingorhabdus cellanae]|uniref:Lipoprotein n=1 Tax=Parasphingorhabdus cellanae TaxID=2806553 RepID=A0ABX7T5A3_9SPHN|nr:hypothetical protein [Parasphingorhabdus cellanae]QTD56306.1 hypothetical protein J4G78_01485 [Parasphingorhabdus cellanae]